MATGDRSFRPVRTAQWDVLKPLKAVQLDEDGDQGSRSIHLLVRLATEPLGYTDFEFDDATAVPNAAAASVSRCFLPQINARLAESGLPAVSAVSPDGLQLDPGRLAFVAERGQLLESAPDISVVLCTRDRPERVGDCLRRLAAQEYPNYEIVVVDNAPSDPNAVPAVLDSLDVNVPVRYVVEPRAGHARGKNAGWLAAKADIVAFIDDDEIPDKHWLAELVRGFSARPNVGCVTGNVLPAELRTQTQLWFEELTGLAKVRGFDQEVFESEFSKKALWPNPPFGVGGNVAFRREVLVDIGGYDVSMGLGTPTKGADDNLVFARTLLARHTLVYQPSALVFHYHRDTLDGLRKQLHGYAVGTVATYAALISREPKLLLTLLTLIPTAIKDPYRKETAQTARILPASLRQLIWRGRLEGIPAYIRSVSNERRMSEMGCASG